MSIYGTWLSIEHPDQWISDMEAHGIQAGVIGDDSDQRELGSPWVYQGSHVLPAVSDPRGGSVDVAAIPAFISRDGRDDGHEGTLKDWLRLSVDSLGSYTEYEGKPYVPAGRSVVVLDRMQVRVLRDTLTMWLEREAEEG
jgi:hypothetical protein